MNCLPSYAIIMQQEIDKIRIPITIVYNKNCRCNPKNILHDLSPCPSSRHCRRWRGLSRACIILEVIPARGIPLAVPLPHKSTPNRSPSRHTHTGNDKETMNMQKISPNKIKASPPSKPNSEIQVSKESSGCL